MFEISWVEKAVDIRDPLTADEEFTVEWALEPSHQRRVLHPEDRCLLKATNAPWTGVAWLICSLPHARRTSAVTRTPPKRQGGRSPPVQTDSHLRRPYCQAGGMSCSTKYSRCVCRRQIWGAHAHRPCSQRRLPDGGGGLPDPRSEIGKVLRQELVRTCQAAS